MDDSVKLKPCPFCGKIPIIKTDIRYPRPECEPVTAYEVVCDNWGCPIYRADSSYCLRKETAVKRWNTRYKEVI